MSARCLGWAALCIAGAVSTPLAWAASVHAVNWVGTWASSQQIPEPRNALALTDLTDATLRQVVHLSIGGREFRVRLSNAFGAEPLHVIAAHVARPVSLTAGTIDASSDRALTFSGRPDVIIPPGADYLSDPITYPEPADANLAVTMYFVAPPTPQTSHPGARETSFLVHGNHVADTELPNALLFEHWFQLSGVEVAVAAQDGTVVTLGDSITDGRGSTTNGNDRWPDELARRLQRIPATRNLAVVNVGTGGNHVLIDGLGPNALARFDRDVLAQAGVRSVIVFEGVNDLGGLTLEHEVPAEVHAFEVQRIVGAYEQMILRAHAHGLRIMGATITPFLDSSYYHPPATTEADRQLVNEWIRAPGHFDSVADFDKTARDPEHPDHILPQYDTGDHLHLTPAGYRALAEAVPLSFFTNDHLRAPAHIRTNRHVRTGTRTKTPIHKKTPRRHHR